MSDSVFNPNQPAPNTDSSPNAAPPQKPSAEIPPDSPQQSGENKSQQTRACPKNHTNCFKSCHNGNNRRPHTNASFRTPAALTTMPRNTETSSAPRRPRTNTPPPEPKKRADGRIVRQPFNGQAHLYEVIQVRLARTQRLVEVNTCALRLAANTHILIRFHRNILLATTVGCRYRRVAEINTLPFVVRIADENDLKIDAENAIFEKQAHDLASEYAIAQNLQMKVLSTDLSHDHKNVTINFASDVRVDFRDMVAYLANRLKLRVEMFQLGLRNGTGLICGLGSCGQLLCCGRFLGQFDPIAVKQLRAQGLATNPKRISGVCGRLYCCMSYEYCDYTRDKSALPKKGKRVMTRWGIGRITDIDMLREDIVVTYDNGEIQRMTPRDFIYPTDELQNKIDNGSIVFPLEPAHFYLNADPQGAIENEKTRSAATSKNSQQPPHANHTPGDKKRMRPKLRPMPENQDNKQERRDSASVTAKTTLPSPENKDQKFHGRPNKSRRRFAEKSAKTPPSAQMEPKKDGATPAAPTQTPFLTRKSPPPYNRDPAGSTASEQPPIKSDAPHTARRVITIKPHIATKPPET